MENTISSLQILNYTIAIVVLTLYSVSYEQLLNFWHDAVAWVHGGSGRGSFNERRVAIVGTIGVVTILAAVSWQLHKISSDAVMRITTSWFRSIKEKH